MREQSNLIQIKRKTIFCFAVILIALIGVTPVLADYLGPHRTVTETTSVCKVILYECQYVASKDTWKYKQENSWSCSNEGKPWQAYSSNAHTCTDNNHTAGYQYWEREDVPQTVTNTYPPATTYNTLENCTLQNGWCITAPQITLSGNEPVAGYSIIAIEGSLNGQTFACMNSDCSVPLAQGANSLTYWALSSFGDSSTMDALNISVDSQLPSIAGAFAGLSGLNGWYVSPVTFNGSASDATSGLESFTCALDGIVLGSCNTITINSEGFHTLNLYARDNAGLVRTLTQNASIDTQNPTLNASISGKLGSNNWYTAATLNASASDPLPGSGVAIFEYNFDSKGWTAFPSSGMLTLSDGKHSVDVRVVDRAGHTVSTSKSFWLDSSAPNITVDSAGISGADGWSTTNLTVAASANDSTSGLKIFEYSLDNSSWTAYTAPLILGEGTHSLSFWAEDEAGLVKQVDRIYQVDTRVPQIAGGLSGVLGMNGWYISDITLSASASDPLPGSGLDTFTYTLNSSTETPFTGSLTLSDGQHTVQLAARDKAGLSYLIEQPLQVDTIPPFLKLETGLPSWIKDKITLDGIASDSGSGLSKVEISTDGGQTWQAVNGTDTWTYAWNTSDGPNGIYEVNLRTIDLAGLTTQQTFPIGVDNRAPEIRLPDSWFQWDTVTLDILDNDSKLAQARVEITDPKGRWPKRVIQLNPQQFPLGFKWDRRFGNDTIADAGTYDVKVTAVDSVGNTADKNASIRILLDILPAGPTTTPQPTNASATSTPVNTVTAILSPAPTDLTITATSSPQATQPVVNVNSSPKATQSITVSVFGKIDATAQATPTSAFLPTPRPSPTQAGVLDLLQSIFVPAQNEESVTEIVSPDQTGQSPEPAGTDNSGVLWGTAAAAAIGSAMAYVQEEKRKREEEKARKAALDAAEEERREKKQERKMEKMEAQRAQEQAWQQARRREEIEDAYLIQNDIKIARLEAEEETRRIIAKMEKKKEAEEERKQAEEKKKAKELNEGLSAYYNAVRQGEKEASNTQATNWWEKAKSFISENIIQPVDSYIYQPYFKQPIEKAKEFIADKGAWVNEYIAQPAIERTKEFVANESAWVKEKIHPVVQPALERTKDFIRNEITSINEKIYQPYIRPAVDRTKDFVRNEITSINEKIYQPYIQPALDRTKEFVASESAWIKEEIYQPYIQPVVKVIDEKIYEPVFEPVVSDINQYIYQPLADKVSNWWDQYGEWVHGALDAAGVIPGFGEAADGINALIYLTEGRYLEAGISALSMIPILGDLGKAGKVGLELAEEVVEEATEKVVKEVTEELIENVAKETLEETVEQVTEVALKEVGEELTDKAVRESMEEVEEKVFKETGEEIVETTTKETFEGVAEKTIKEVREEVAEKISEETAEKATKEVTDVAATKVTEDNVATISSVSIEKVSTVAAEDIVEETLEQTSEEAAQFIASLRKQYGDEMVDAFLPFCDKYGINPYDVLTRPPAEGQSLVGWGLGIENPINPANHPLVELNLTKDELNHILEISTVRPDSKVVVLGYGKGSAKPYYILSDEIGGCHLSLSNEAWSPFDDARANFLVDINIPFIEKGIEERKIFVFNIKEKVIIDPLNAERFSLPELRLIELEKNNYIQVSIKDYTAYIPAEQLDTYEQYLPSSLKD